MTGLTRWVAGALLAGAMGLGFFATNNGPYQTTMETHRYTQSVPSAPQAKEIPNSVTSGVYAPGDFIGTRLSPNEYLVNPDAEAGASQGYTHQ